MTRRPITNHHRKLGYVSRLTIRTVRNVTLMRLPRRRTTAAAGHPRCDRLLLAMSFLASLRCCYGPPSRSPAAPIFFVLADGQQVFEAVHGLFPSGAASTAHQKHARIPAESGCAQRDGGGGGRVTGGEAGNVLTCRVSPSGLIGQVDSRCKKRQVDLGWTQNAVYSDGAKHVFCRLAPIRSRCQLRLATAGGALWVERWVLLCSCPLSYLASVKYAGRALRASNRPTVTALARRACRALAPARRISI